MVFVCLMKGESMKKRGLAVLLAIIMLVGSPAELYAYEQNRAGEVRAQQEVSPESDAGAADEILDTEEVSDPAGHLELERNTESAAVTEEAFDPAAGIETEASETSEPEDSENAFHTEEIVETGKADHTEVTGNTESVTDAADSETRQDMEVPLESESPSVPTGLIRQVEVNMDLSRLTNSLSDENDEPSSIGSVIAENEWDKYTTRYIYNQLNADQRLVWDKLDAVCREYLYTDKHAERYWDPIYLEVFWHTEPVRSKMDVNELARLGSLFRICNPQYYFLSHKYSSVGNMYVFGIYPSFADGKARMEATAKVQKQLGEWNAQIAALKTDEEKVRKIHDLIISKVEYNDSVYEEDFDEYTQYTQSVYSVFCTDLTVCAGYSMAFEMLCNGAGIDAFGVTSYSHEWNKVRINDSWYNVDCTWDDSNGIIYDYYVRSDLYLDNLNEQSKFYHMVESFWKEYIPVCSLDSNSTSFEPGTVPAITQQTEAPVIQKGTGGNPNKVTITSATPGAQIYYTLDETIPTPASTASMLYREPFVCEDGDVVTAVAVCDTYWDSELTDTKVRFNTVEFNGNGAQEGQMQAFTYEAESGAVLPANTFLRHFYTFTGWNTASDGSGTSYQELQAAPMEHNQETIVLYAQWKANTYSIGLKGNGSTSGSMAAVKAEYGSGVLLPENTYKKTGAVFTGWNTKADGSGRAYANRADTTKLIEAEGKGVTLYAQWKLTRYSVTYVLNGGTNSGSNPAGYNIGTATISLKDPIRTGYTFAGWYRDAGYKNRVSSIPRGSTGNLTFYAKWTVNQYTIAFQGNGSTEGSMSSMKSCKYGSGYQLKANAFKKKGYAFKSWNTRADGSGQSYSDRAQVKNLTSEDGATVKLYAQWEKIKYKITYKLDGGTNSKSNPSAYTVTTGTVTLKNPTRKGYTFQGWYTDSKYKKAISQIKKGSTGNKTLYAKWSVNKYNIKFYGNKNTGGSMPAMKSCKYASSYKLKANKFIRKGYTFTGWNTKADGSGKSYKNKQSVKKLSSKSGATVKLYAQWKVTGYKVKFYGNKNTGGKMSDLNCKYGKSYKLKSNSFKRTGYKFKGWNTRADGSGKSYKNKQSVKNLTSRPNATVKLYAQWSRVKYRINYKLNGGKNKKDNPSVYYVNTGTVKLKNPLRKGYSFKGWYSDSGYKKKVTQIKKGSTGNKTLYAKWSANRYSVVFQPNGGTGSVPGLSCTYGKKASLPVCGYVRNGYYFDSWNTKADGSGTACQPSQEIKNLTSKSGGTVTLYAVWKKYGAKELRMSEDVIKAVNRERSAAGAETLTEDSALTAIAQQRAREIASYFSHVRPDKSSGCFTLYNSSGYAYYYAGENIAYGYGNAAGVMQAWMNSQGHRDNILQEGYQKIGVGCYDSNGVYYWVQNFSD